MAKRDFRVDINGLRGWAVISVVLFHFLPHTVPGGFAGVDVFFVISGFLMTGIILSGMENKNFSLLRFYMSRANRIIPALSVLCLFMLAFGYLYLYGPEFKLLGKHIVGSAGFFSNILFWKESGYFDTSSHDKWLLHTWSLSVEWQFYLLYPLMLLALSRLLFLQRIKAILVAGTLVGFLFSCFAANNWPEASYYLLPTRAWEMLLGGVAYAYPLRASNVTRTVLESVGLTLIAMSYFLINSTVPWPGYHAVVPTLGAYLVILANRQDSRITNNRFLQFVGKRSYSIYLWHWPIVVFGFHFGYDNWWLPGIPLSLLLGWLSYKYVESINFRNYETFHRAFLSKPVFLAVIPGCLAFAIYISNGLEARFPKLFNDLHHMASLTSPYRSDCHISSYRAPEESCEYFSDNVTWATLGDSHTIELAYELAIQLREKGQGLKHFSFSGCPPSFELESDSSECAAWYDDSFQYIANDPDIRNVVVGHRWSFAFWGDNIETYPELPSQDVSASVTVMVQSMDKLIFALAEKKERVFVLLPMPELGVSVQNLINDALDTDLPLELIRGTSLDYYRKRNSLILNHFDAVNYPENVYLIEPEKLFCDSEYCYAVQESKPLYYDDDHPSLAAAEILSREILKH
ncbi:acyltransferase family protein [uncultured Microbulbifer sp.]|uniref:acyltransferase family protein n=1 Tax=uncultured Microbulbifer sp. TaxID=348147 RepID=UPI00262D2A45|nr:acyltransferase family protein [uncultured Microbulbifer sp.]